MEGRLFYLHLYMRKNFVVYKSSAGSGKTFTLVKEYLKIALSEISEQPQLYKKILAVTFTNKAATEMKLRILDALKNIAKTNTTSTLFSILKQELQLSSEELSKRSKTLLNQILHNYSDFAISTIDSFTHKIVKTFAFDLKLPVNFTVETNTNDFYNKVVSQLLSKVGEDKELTNLLVEFSLDNTSNNLSWDPERKLSEFTASLLQEDAEMHLHKLKAIGKEELKIIHQTLKEFVIEFKNQIKLHGTKGLELIKQKQLEDSHFFNTFKGPQTFFRKCALFEFDGLDNLINTTVKNALTDNGKWQSKNNSPAEIIALDSILPQLNAIVKEVISYTDEHYKSFALYLLLEKNIYSLILVNELQQIASEFKQEEQIIFISEFNSKISKIVANEPSPFIYERLGERYHHFLLDEFQDTSTLQWQNILPLLDNSLANGWFNLVVGDGKQSIYRWRNANVKQFNDLPKLDGSDANEILAERQLSLARNFEENNLNTNYRSLGNIVDFNNTIFDFLSENLLTNELKTIYSNQKQNKQFNSGGYVSIHSGEKEKEEVEDLNFNLVLEHIKIALSSDFAYSDICVIVRGNKHGNLVANFLSENKIPVVSSESLLLKSCAEINCIVGFLNYLINPSDKINGAAVITYLVNSRSLASETYSNYLKLLNQGKNLFEVLQLFDINFKEEHLQQKNIFDICIELISKLGLEIKKPQYIRFFLDEVNDYLVNKTGSVNDFLIWWEKRKEKASLIIPDGIDAVRIMTIHKSKGLEFPIVILPFVNWGVTDTPVSWIDLNNFNLDLPVGLLQHSKKMEEAGLGEVYSEEKNIQVLDNLNLMYVAFTRAIERLHIITIKATTQKKETVNKWIQSYLKETIGSLTNNFNEWGVLEKKQHLAKKDLLHSFNISQLQFNSNPHLINIKGAHKLNLRQVQGEETARENGIKMHYILSQINSRKDILPVLNKMMIEGLVAAEEKQNLEQKIINILENSILKKYFLEHLKYKNEAEIITDDGELLRPDKIVFTEDHIAVIDYKTGKQNAKAYLTQMNKYSDALLKMEHTKIKKVLVYVEDNVVEELN